MAAVERCQKRSYKSVEQWAAASGHRTECASSAETNSRKKRVLGQEDFAAIRTSVRRGVYRTAVAAEMGVLDLPRFRRHRASVPTHLQWHLDPIAIPQMNVEDPALRKSVRGFETREPFAFADFTGSRYRSVALVLQVDLGDVRHMPTEARAYIGSRQPNLAADPSLRRCVPALEDVNGRGSVVVAVRVRIVSAALVV